MFEEVAIILPVFNGELFVADAIASVQAQTLSAWRLFVIDDGSSDRTPDIVRALARDDDRVTYCRQENAGVSVARNHGLRLASTRWVGLLDHDDRFLPEKLESQLSYLHAHPEVACLGSRGYRIGSDGRRLGNYEADPTTAQRFAELRRRDQLIYMPAPSVVLDREIALALGGFRPQPAGNEDVEMWARIADENEVRALPQRLVEIRIHAESTTAKNFHRQRLSRMNVERNIARRRSGQPELSFDAFMEAWQRLPPHERRRERRISRSLAFYRKAGSLLADRDPRGAWYLLRSLLLKPGMIWKRAIRQVVKPYDS